MYVGYPISSAKRLKMKNGSKPIYSYAFIVISVLLYAFSPYFLQLARLVAAQRTI